MYYGIQTLRFISENSPLDLACVKEETKCLDQPNMTSYSFKPSVGIPGKCKGC